MTRLFPGVICALLAAAPLAARDSGATIGDGVTRALLPGSLAGCADDRHVTLRVALAIASSREKPFTEILRDEVTSIWHRHGVALQWIDVASLRGADKVVRLVVQDEELASGAPEPHYVVGWIGFVGGRPQQVIRVSRRTALAYVARFLARQTGRPIEGVLEIPKVRVGLTRLLAWSLAHEIGHYLLATPRHTTTGLMRRAFLPEDLIGVREAAVSLTPVESGRLQAWAAACRRADARTPRQR